MRVYQGVRGDEAFVYVMEDGVPAAVLNGRQALRNHSPTGLEWGYLGSGPAQLALALLADATGDDAYACVMYQEFKAQHVSRFPAARWSDEGEERGEAKIEWTLSKAQILEWVERNPAPPERLERVEEELQSQRRKSGGRRGA